MYYSENSNTGRGSQGGRGGKGRISYIFYPINDGKKRPPKASR